MVQLSGSYEDRFAGGDTPWEDDTISPAVTGLVSRYAPEGVTILDVGCGLGLNARWLAEQGFKVTACDVSSTAIAKAKSVPGAEAVARWKRCDFLQDYQLLGCFDVVFDRGLLHTFSDAGGQRLFATAIAAVLKHRGIWLSISGSADNIDVPGARGELGLPRLSVVEIAEAVEEQFEVLCIERAVYGSTPGVTDFGAFACAFRRR